jgi:hypothetical protein
VFFSLFLFLSFFFFWASRIPPHVELWFLIPHSVRFRSLWTFLSDSEIGWTQMSNLFLQLLTKSLLRTCGNSCCLYCNTFVAFWRTFPSLHLQNPSYLAYLFSHSNKPWTRLPLNPKP